MSRNGCRTESGRVAVEALRGRSPQGPRGDSAVPRRRWAQGTPPPRTPGCRTRVGLSHELCGPVREIPQRSWVCALGKNCGFSPPWGPQRENPPRCAPGLGTAPGGSCGRSALRNRPCGGAAPGGGGGSAPLGWQERRRLRRGRSRHFQEDGATYGKHLEFTGPAGTRREVQRFHSAPSGRGRAAPAASREGPWRSERLGRHGPRYRLPRGGCAARSRGGGETRPARALSCISSGRWFR